MAIRRHITATRAEEAQIRAVFREILGEAFENVSIEHQDDWRFFTTSVWGVSRVDLFKGLRELNQIALLATTEDACRWYLSIFRPVTDPVSFLHEFDLFDKEHSWEEIAEEPETEEIDPRLAFLLPDPQDVFMLKRPWSQFDAVADRYTEMNVPIDEKFRDDVTELTLGEACNRFREYEWDRFRTTLQEAGVDFDTDRLRKAFYWETTTRRERKSDIGNLPRVLTELGIGGSIADYVRDVAVEQAALATQDASDGDLTQSAVVEPEDTISPVLAIARQFPLVPLQGAPVPLYPSEYSLLEFISKSLFIDEESPAIIELRLSRNTQSSDPLPPRSAGLYMTAQPTADGWRVETMHLAAINRPGEGSWNWMDVVLTWHGAALAAAFRQPVDGTSIEIDLVDRKRPSNCLRFAGKTESGRWLVDHTWPGMASHTLTAALELARTRHATEHTLRDDKEAEAIWQALPRHSRLSSFEVSREGLRFQLVVARESFTRMLLRYRFAATWDFAPKIAALDADYEQSRRESLEMRRRAARARRNRSAPCDKKRVVYRGRASVYWAADMSAWSNLEATPQESSERALRELRFECLGDFVCRKFRDVLLRGYVAPDLASYALLIGNYRGILTQEFVSHFANGSFLTTTNSDTPESQPDIDAYVLNEPALTLAQRFAKHRWGIARLTEAQATTIAPLDPTLQGLVSLFDNQLSKAGR